MPRWEKDDKKELNPGKRDIRAGLIFVSAAVALATLFIGNMVLDTLEEANCPPWVC